MFRHEITAQRKVMSITLVFKIQKQPPKVLRLSVGLSGCRKKKIRLDAPSGSTNPSTDPPGFVFVCVVVACLYHGGYGYVDLLTSGQRETKIKTARKHRAGLRKTIPSAISQACAPRDGC